MGFMLVVQNFQSKNREICLQATVISDQSKLPNVSTDTLGAPSWSWASVLDAPIYRYAVKGHGYMIDQPEALCIQVHGVQSDQDVGLMHVLKGSLYAIPFSTEQVLNGAVRCSLKGEVPWLFFDRPTQLNDGMLFLFPVMYTMSCADLTERDSQIGVSNTASRLADDGSKNVAIFDRCHVDKSYYDPSNGCDGASADINKVLRLA